MKYQRLLSITACSLLFSLPAEAKSHLVSGPMLGHTNNHETSIWLQTNEPATVHLTYSRLLKRGEIGISPVYSSSVIKTSPDNFLTATFKLKGLDTNRQYKYTIYLNGKAIKSPIATEFKTTPTYQAAQPKDFTIALGSCHYVTDGPWDTIGLYHGREFGVVTKIPQMKPDLMLWLGDYTYLRWFDMTSIHGINYRFSHTRKLPETRQLLGAIPNYAIWDDHDFGPNDSDRTFDRKEDSLTVWKHYWANPANGTPNIPGTFYKFNRQDVEFFMTDGRYYRAPEGEPESDNKTYFGKAQLQWLKSSLKQSQATFKLVALGSQALNYNAQSEVLPMYKREYKDFMKWLLQEKISGVVFISGDRHFTELLKIKRPGHYPLYEFTSSPMTSNVVTGIKAVVNDDIELVNDLRVPGTLVNKERNFGLIKVQGAKGQRRLLLETYNKDGKILWSHIITEQELR